MTVHHRLFWYEHKFNFVCHFSILSHMLPVPKYCNPCSEWAQSWRASPNPMHKHSWRPKLGPRRSTRTASLDCLDQNAVSSVKTPTLHPYCRRRTLHAPLNQHTRWHRYTLIMTRRFATPPKTCSLNKHQICADTKSLLGLSSARSHMLLCNKCIFTPLAFCSDTAWFTRRSHSFKSMRTFLVRW